MVRSLTKAHKSPLKAKRKKQALESQHISSGDACGVVRWLKILSLGSNFKFTLAKNIFPPIASLIKT